MKGFKFIGITYNIKYLFSYGPVLLCTILTMVHGVPFNKNWCTMLLHYNLLCTISHSRTKLQLPSPLPSCSTTNDDTTPPSCDFFIQFISPHLLQVCVTTIATSFHSTVNLDKLAISSCRLRQLGTNTPISGGASSMAVVEQYHTYREMAG